MSILSPVRIRVEQNIITRVYRKLSGTGGINVSVGQEVIPSDIIGSSQIPSGFRTINVAHFLSVAPKDIKKYLKRDIGQRIYKGELLAFKEGGLFGGKKFVTSPTDGILDYINEQTGEIKLNFLPVKIDTPAGVYGIVEKVDSLRGYALIRTQVSRIYGVFGSGNPRDGILRVLGKREGVVKTDEIRKVKQEGQILIGGSLIYKEAISMAISAGITGIITGGIGMEDYKSISNGRVSFPRKIENDIGTSIVVCEGFGSLPIGEDIYKILYSYNGKFVFLDGNKAFINLPSYESKSMQKVKATILPIEEVFEGAYRQIVPLILGSRVRIIGNYLTGEQGKVVNIDSQTSLLPSSVRVILVTVETNYKKFRVPVDNLEVIV